MADYTIPSSIRELLQTLPSNPVIFDCYVKASSILCTHKYKKVMCSVSGGADSDLLVDICTKLDIDNVVEYVWFDTGIEFRATKDHLTYLENRYNITIRREKAIKSIPLSCREYGQPFLSKHVSEMISRLQRHNFQWENESFEVLNEKYPNCQSALMWWCEEKGENSHFNISRNQYLKEFMIQNPPKFAISNKCCLYAKKKVSHSLIKAEKYDLIIVGLRKAEGGVRATRYKTCFSTQDQTDYYRPLFWFSDSDKKDYEDYFNIRHSGCYTKYGLKRTGCVGCPYGRNLEDELNACEVYEKGLYKASQFVFGQSYEYTKQYYEFVQLMKLKHSKQQIKGQMTIDDFLGGEM